MKTFFIALALISTAASANMITGQVVLKGTARTKMMYQGVEVNCRVKVDEVKNNLVEDSFGNPAYYVWTKVELSSSLSATTPINHSADIRFTNIHKTETGTLVSDTLYVGENAPKARLTVDARGRIKQAVFPVGANLVTCNF